MLRPWHEYNATHHPTINKITKDEYNHTLLNKLWYAYSYHILKSQSSHSSSLLNLFDSRISIVSPSPNQTGWFVTMTIPDIFTSIDDFSLIFAPHNLPVLVNIDRLLNTEYSKFMFNDIINETLYKDSAQNALKPDTIDVIQIRLAIWKCANWGSTNQIAKWSKNLKIDWSQNSLVRLRVVSFPSLSAICSRDSLFLLLV